MQIDRFDREFTAKCAVAVVLAAVGFWTFYVPNDTNPKIPFLAAMIFGLGGQWAVWRLARWVKLTILFPRGE